MKMSSNKIKTVVIKKRTIIIFWTILWVFIVLYFRTLFILHQERREINQNKFLYLACSENLNAFKAKAYLLLKQETLKHEPNSWYATQIQSPRIRNILDSLKGTRTGTGFQNLTTLDSSNFILPHFKAHKHSLHPAFHVAGGRNMVGIVIGITTVKRFRGNYLMDTLRDLVAGLTEDEKQSTLIIVMIGEIDLEFVLNTAMNIEKNFTREVNNGLIEVISPLKSYYPTTAIPSTLGDSLKRTLWRSKHVLDTIYVMAYGQSKGSYYLMMEDDIVAVKGYMTEMKLVIAHTTKFKRYWAIIDFCHRFNGPGKLLRSSDVQYLIKYLQLYYYNMPLDFLIESYLRNKVCGISRSQKECVAAVNKIRGRSSVPLFKHVGLYSSLKGKTQKVEDLSYLTGRTFYPHVNPPLKYIICSFKSSQKHTIEQAYEGKSYFLGRVKGGFVIEFWFKQPIVLKSYTFQSGNYIHRNYLFYNGIVEVFQEATKNFTSVGVFDEFGCAEGKIADRGFLSAIRLRITKVKRPCVVLSEIELVPDNATFPTVHLF